MDQNAGRRETSDYQQLYLENISFSIIVNCISHNLKIPPKISKVTLALWKQCVEYILGEIFSSDTRKNGDR